MALLDHKKPYQHKKPVKQIDWEKSDKYKIAVLLKIIRAMKTYGHSAWMSAELKKIGISI